MRLAQKLLMRPSAEAEGWDLSTASYDSVSMNPTSQGSNPYDVEFKDDGTKMYFLDGTGVIYQYSLSTAWDIGSASYDSKSFDTGSQTVLARSCTMSADGTKLYVIDDFEEKVFEYDMSTAWDISTASYNSNSFTVPVDQQGIEFKPDGTKMYSASKWFSGLGVYQYSLSTAWDITSATQDGTRLTLSGVDVLGIQLKSDGAKAYVLRGDDKVYQYSLSTAWDISTATSDAVTLDLGVVGGIPNNIRFKPDGTKLYACDLNPDRIFQYSVEGF